LGFDLLDDGVLGGAFTIVVGFGPSFNNNFGSGVFLSSIAK